jgi:transcriptional regulator with XRE-family HTH domain
MSTPIISLADVRSRRLAAGLSQQDLAQRAHCSLSVVRLFDRGYTPEHSATLARVEHVLEQLERDRLAPGDNDYEPPAAA